MPNGTHRTDLKTQRSWRRDAGEWNDDLLGSITFVAWESGYHVENFFGMAWVARKSYLGIYDRYS